MPSTSRLDRGEKMLREVCRELAWRTEDFLGEWGGEVLRRDVGNWCGGRWYPSARYRVARTQDYRRSRHGACTLRRPLGWTCCPGGWGRAYEEGAVGHQLEMMVSEVAFQLESEVGKLFLSLIHNGACIKESIGLETHGFVELIELTC